MKKILLILFLAFGYTYVFCQSQKPDVIATAGNFFTNSSNSVSWTIGECIPETFANANNQLTQGFQQGVYYIKTEVDNTISPMEIKLFPNPVTDFVNLKLQIQNLKNFSYQLFDSNGKCLLSEKITSDLSKINLQEFARATYFLNVYAPDQQLMKSFKIIKVK